MVMPTLTNTLDIVGKIIEAAGAAKTIVDSIDKSNKADSQNATTEIVKQVPVITQPVEVVPRQIEPKQVPPVVVNINVYINDENRNPLDGKRVLVESVSPR